MNRHPARPMLAFVAALLSAANGCDAGSTTQATEPPVVTMTVGNQKVDLEVAADNPSREHGLMERDKLPAHHGMIFVFSEEKPLSFWMHHTRFPLDIIFADHAGRVVSVHTMKAYDETTTPSDGPASYAIELNANEAAAVKPGDTLKLPDLPVAR